MINSREWEETRQLVKKEMSQSIDPPRCWAHPSWNTANQIPRWRHSSWQSANQIAHGDTADHSASPLTTTTTTIPTHCTHLILSNWIFGLVFSFKHPVQPSDSAETERDIWAHKAAENKSLFSTSPTATSTLTHHLTSSSAVTYFWILLRSMKYVAVNDHNISIGGWDIVLLKLTFGSLLG